MTHLIVWLVICVALALTLRARVSYLVIVILALWVAVPAVADQILTGVVAGTFNLAPATWLVIVVFLVQLSHDPRRLGRAVADRLLLVIAVLVFALAAILATKLSAVHGSTGLVFDQIIGPFLLFLIVTSILDSEPGAVLRIVRGVIAVAAAEAAVGIAQWLTNSTIFYHSYYAGLYWFQQPNFDRWMGTTDHPLELSLILCLAIPLLSYTSRLGIKLPLLVLLYAGIIVTQSRTGLVIGGAGVLLVFCTARTNFTARLLGAVALFGAGFFFFQSSISTGVTDRISNDSGSAIARGDAFDYFWAHLSDYLFVGGGTGASYRITEQAGLLSSFESSILMYAVDYGFVFAVIYFLAQLALVVVNLNTNRQLAIGFSALLAVVMPQTFSTLAIKSAAGTVVWLVLALSCASAALFKQPSTEGITAPDPLADHTGPSSSPDPSRPVYVS